MRDHARGPARGTLRLLAAAAMAGCASAGSRVPPPGDASPAELVGRLVLPPSPPPSLQSLVGVYAAPGDTLLVLEDAGRLFLLGADSAQRPLRAVGDTLLVAGGSADGAPLVASRDARGTVTALSGLGRARLARLAVAPEDSGSFRIVPQRPVEALRAEALAATPPAQPDSLRPPELVEVVTLDSTIRLDVRYATTNNFMGARFYDEPRVFLQRPAAEALARVASRLRPLGYGLLVFDGYRPWYVTRMFWDATPPHQREFVADPANGSRHNRGAAVDLTLYDLATGRPVAMPSGYDEFSRRAHAAWPGGTARERAHRELLRRTMESEGFRVYDAEWWHFDHAIWRRYPVLNLTFDRLAPR